MANSQTAQQNPPHLNDPHFVNLDTMGRNYGVALGLMTAVYLLIVNALTTDLPLGLRFAKYLLIVGVVWFATKKLHDRTPEGEIFKTDIGLTFRIAIWAILTITVLNIVLVSISPNLGFEQFMNESDSFGDMMVNSFFMAMETFVMVLMAGFIFMQYYKGKGSPED